MNKALGARKEPDRVAYLQTVYRDPAHPVDVRIDAAVKSARHERPALAATLTRDVTPEGPVAVKLALDYSLLTVQEMAQMLALIEKATPRQTEGSEQRTAAVEAAMQVVAASLRTRHPRLSTVTGSRIYRLSIATRRWALPR